QVFIDLRFFLTWGWLVQRELHAVVAVGDDLAHERRILGGNIVTDEFCHVYETHYAVVEVHPTVHLPEFHIAHAVINRLEQPFGCVDGLQVAALSGGVPGEVRPPVARTVDKGMPGLRSEERRVGKGGRSRTSA